MGPVIKFVILMHIDPSAVLRDLGFVIGHGFLHRQRPPPDRQRPRNVYGSIDAKLWLAPAAIGGISDRMVSLNYDRGRPLNAPAAFIHPCQPVRAKQPPTGPGWVHELKHDGYRLQIHVRDGRVRLFTMNGADWSKRYPRIVEEATRIKGSAVMDAEVVCLIKKGI